MPTAPPTPAVPSPHRRVLVAAALAAGAAVAVVVGGLLPEALLPFAASLPLVVAAVALIEGRLGGRPPALRTGLPLVLLALLPATGTAIWTGLLVSDTLRWARPDGLGAVLLDVGSWGRQGVALLVVGAGLGLAVLDHTRRAGRALVLVGAGMLVDALALAPSAVRAVEAVHENHVWLSIFGAHGTALACALGAVIWAREGLALAAVLLAFACTPGGTAAHARAALPAAATAPLPALPPALRFGGPPVAEALVGTRDEGPDNWPCLGSLGLDRFPSGLRAGAAAALAADAPVAELVSAADALRRHSIFRLGVQGRAEPPPPPGLAQDLLGHPVFELLLDRPPAGSWSLSAGPPPAPVGVCALAAPAEGTVGALLSSLVAAREAGCGAVALAPSTATAPEPCPPAG